jgi:alginate production protein
MSRVGFTERVRWWTAVALLVALGSAEAAVEQRLKVEGTWVDDRLVVTRVEERDPGKDATRVRILGSVRAIDRDAQQFTIGPVTVEWTTAQAALIEELRVGAAVEVDARLVLGWRFQLISLQPEEIESPDHVEMIGSVTGVQRDELAAESRVELAGVPTWVPASLYSNGRIRLRRLDDKRPDQQVRAVLGNVAVTFGGELEFISDYEADRDLDDDEEDDVRSSEQQFQLEAFAEFSDSLSAFAELNGGFSQEFSVEDETTDRDHELRRGELWLFWDQPFGTPLGVQVGRQNFAEQREWWWDENLDAVRVLYGTRQLSWEIAIAEELGRIEIGGRQDPQQLDVTRYLASIGWQPSSAVRLDGFYLRQNDGSSRYRVGTVVIDDLEDEDDSDLTWLGARISGELDLFDDTALAYWFDTAIVDGRETAYDFTELTGDLLRVDGIESRNRSGRATDVGASLSWGRWSRLEPTLTFGYARGSGGADESSWFRQTGLNDNNGRFNGVDRFRYYGELARPQLSNLTVSTVAVGFRINDNSSIELVHHAYQQVTPSTEHTLRVDPDANGRSADLGSEFDVVLGIEEWQHWEIEVVGSYFLPGDAFAAADPMWFGVFKVNYNF